MQCKYCGAANEDKAARCISCGFLLREESVLAPIQSMQDAAKAPEVGTTVPNYMIFSILTTVLCCMPVGLLAILFSLQVNQKLAQGDIRGAREASNRAKLFCWISFGSIVAIVLVFLTLIAFGIVVPNILR